MAIATNRKVKDGGLLGEPRSFHLTVHPEGSESFGLKLSTKPGSHSADELIISASAAQVGRVFDGVMVAVKSSGLSPGSLSVNRGTPMELSEAAGVRLSLVFFASQPLTRHDRIRAIVAGINVMSIEETYYWYAKCIGAESSRARKAIRVLLSDEKAADS